MGLFDTLAGLFGRAGDSPDEGRRTGGDSVDFAAVAEAFAADNPDREFDFGVASLDRLDEYAKTRSDDGPSDPADADAGDGPPPDPVRSLGCYFGEVLVREFDGEWVHDDSVRVVVPAGSTNVAVSPFDAARVALRDEPGFARTAARLRERVGEGADEEAGLELDLGGDDEGSADETPTEPAVESRFPAVALDAGMDPDTAHERTLDAFEAAGYTVTAGDVLNSMPDNPVEGVGTLFLFYTATEMYTGLVYVGDWTESDTAAVVSLARYLQDDDDLDGLHVVSAVDPPDAVKYLTTTHPRSAFALDATADRPGTFTPESAPEFADLGAALLARHFDVRIDRTDTGTLAGLDEIVLDELRPIRAHDERYEGYVPREALLAVGALAGEVMRHGLERESYAHDGSDGATRGVSVTVDWGVDEEISSTGVVLRITTADADGALTVNPVGKTFKLYRSGAGDSLAGLYETCLAVVERELSALDPDGGDEG